MIPERRVELAVRAKENPILKPVPEHHEWEKNATFNAAAIDLKGTVHILYRAMGDDNTSVSAMQRAKTASKSPTR
jgi:predicted GH43/DUF377 family glycosyl hydrolase